MPAPFFIQLEPTNRCNLSCLFCSRKTSKDGIRDISLEKLAGVLDENPNVLVVKLQGLGEPLMHPCLEQIAREIKRRGIILSTITNGTLIKENRGLIEKYFDMVEVSLDTLDPVEFMALRKGSTLPEVLEGVRILTDIRDNNGKLKVGINSVFSHLNVDQDEKIRRFCRENKLIWTRDRLTNWVTYGDKRWNASHEFALKDREVNGKRIKTRHYCAWSYYKAYITAEGNYTPCCIRMEKIFEIDGGWNDKKMREFRRLRGSTQFFPMCEHCPD